MKIFCGEEVRVYANERLVTIHMAQGREQTVTLPIDCRQDRELFTGKTVLVKIR